MKISNNIFFIIPVIALFLVSCSNDDAQSDFESQAYGEAANFTETSFQGDIVRIDSDDWRISPLYIGLITVQPAYPNPIQYGSNLELEVDLNGLPVNSVLELGFLNPSNQWIFLQQQEVIFDFDTKVFRIDTRQFGGSAEQARGLRRMLLFDGNQRLITYGDILIQ